MIKASDLKAKLVDLGVESADADRIVKGRIESGDAENDLGAASSESAIDPTALDAMAAVFAERLAKGATAATETVTDDDDDDADIDGDVADPRLDVLAKGADRIVAAVDAKYEQLAKGWLAHGQVYAALAKGVVGLTEQLTGLRGQVDAIAKALGQPIPPRAVTGSVEQIDAPGEQGAYADEMVVRDRLLAKGHAIISDDSIPLHRRHQVASGISALDAGALPSQVARELQITLDA